MNRYKRTAVSQYIVIGLVVISLIAMGFLTAYLMRSITFDDGFVVPWAAGRVWLLEGVSPYSETVTQMARSTLRISSFQGQMPDHTLLMVPVFNLIFTLPLSLLPYEIARVVWMTLLTAVSGGVVYLGIKISGWKTTVPEGIGLIALFIAWFPGVVTIISGLLSPITIGLIVLGLFLVKHEQDTPAGFVFSLTFAGFSISTIILFVILIWAVSRRRWSLMVSYFSGLVFLWIVSLLLLPTWPLDWLRVLFNLYDDWEWVQTPLVRVANQLPGIASYLTIFLHAAFGIYLIVLVVTLWGQSGRAFIWKVLTIVVISYLFNFQATYSELFILLPAVFLVFRVWSERWRVLGRILSYILLVLLAAGSWYFALPAEGFARPDELGGLIILVPLVTLSGLIWIRWWALNIPKLPYERQ